MKPTLLASSRLAVAVAAALVTSTGAASAAVIISSSAPTTNILSSDISGNINSNLFPQLGTAPAPIAGNNNHARGQLFSLPDGSGTAFQITAITFQKDVAGTFNNDSLKLSVFQGSATDFTSGTGHTGGPNDGTNFYDGTTVTNLYFEDFTLTGTIADDSFITLELATPLTVAESSDFGFFMTYDPVVGTSPDRIGYMESGNGDRLSIDNNSHDRSSRMMNYIIQGVAIPEPSVSMFGALAALALFRRRRA